MACRSDANQITVNGETDKLAPNIGQAVILSEWGLKHGEAVAISILSDQGKNYVEEDFEGFTTTTFDGKTITV
jgi:hypothetical protein